MAHPAAYDETGVVQAIVWKSLREKQRLEVLRARRLAVYGTWQHEGEVKNLIAESSQISRHFWDN